MQIVLYATDSVCMNGMVEVRRLSNGRETIQEEEKSFDFSSSCDSEAIRTLDPRLRRALLYPAELRNLPIYAKRGITSFASAKIVRFFRCTKYFLAFFCFNGKMVVKESDFLFKISDHRTQVMHCNTATMQGEVAGLLHLVE